MKVDMEKFETSHEFQTFFNFHVSDFGFEIIIKREISIFTNYSSLRENCVSPIFILISNLKYRKHS